MCCYSYSKEMQINDRFVFDNMLFYQLNHSLKTTRPIFNINLRFQGLLCAFQLLSNAVCYCFNEFYLKKIQNYNSKANSQRYISKVSKLYQFHKQFIEKIPRHKTLTYYSTRRNVPLKFPCILNMKQRIHVSESTEPLFMT